jgi:transcriptional regulator with XRE-family HTH domain
LLAELFHGRFIKKPGRHGNQGHTVSKKLGEYLRIIRHNRKLSLRDVEKKAHISNAYLSQIERGERGVPSIKMMSKLAEAYGVSVVDLIEIAILELKKEAFDFNILVPDTKYVYEGYEKLSGESKQSLTEFLQFLLEKEKVKSELEEEEK